MLYHWAVYVTPPPLFFEDTGLLCHQDAQIPNISNFSSTGMADWPHLIRLCYCCSGVFLSFKCLSRISILWVNFGPIESNILLNLEALKWLQILIFLLKVLDWSWLESCIKGLNWTPIVIAIIFIVTRGENKIEKKKKTKHRTLVPKYHMP